LLAVAYLATATLTPIPEPTLSPSDFEPETPVNHTIHLDKTPPADRWTALFEKKCSILRGFVPTQMDLVDGGLKKLWNSSLEEFKPRLFDAYQKADHLKSGDFLTELKSISDGCKIPLDQMLVLNYVYDLYGGGCTSIVFNNHHVRNFFF
jgi:hypothetical protein